VIFHVLNRAIARAKIWEKDQDYEAVQACYGRSGAVDRGVQVRRANRAAIVATYGGSLNS
jgi:hypothetical protein